MRCFAFCLLSCLLLGCGDADTHPSSLVTFELADADSYTLTFDLDASSQTNVGGLSHDAHLEMLDVEREENDALLVPDANLETFDAAYLSDDLLAVSPDQFVPLPPACDEPMILYLDQDRDGHGNPQEMQPSCVYLPNYTLIGDDCNDEDQLTFPGASELCDHIDNNCDTLEDNEAVNTFTFYRDADTDWHGDPLNSTDMCWRPEGYVVNSDDCDDQSNRVNPGFGEMCDDGQDNDCNGFADADDPACTPTTIP